MNRQHISQWVVVVMLVTSFLAGCGAPATQPTPPPTAAPTIQPTPPPTALPTAQPTLPPPTATPTQASGSLEDALAGKYKGTTVDVGGVWDGKFATAYQKSLLDFVEKTGITVRYQTRDEANPSFQAAIEAGAGPDLMEFGYPGTLLPYAKEGKIIDVTKVVSMEKLRARYDQKWLDWATMAGPNGPIVAGIWGTVWVDSLVWYPKAAFDKAGYKVPTTWQEMVALSDKIVRDGGTPWCVEDGTWGDDWGVGVNAYLWIADILLRTSSPADYDKWLRGGLKYNSPQVKRAVQLMSDIWFKPGYSYVVRQALNKTYMWDITPLMFDTPPKCWLMKEPSSMVGFDGKSANTAFSTRVYSKDYAFFLTPPIDKAYGAPVQVDGHITAMFHDRPEVRALLEYLTTGAQLENWIKSGTNFGFSPHKAARPDWLTDARERAIADVVVAAEKAGNLYYYELMSLEADSRVLGALGAYVNGDIDLDTALNRCDSTAP